MKILRHRALALGLSAFLSCVLVAGCDEPGPASDTLRDLERNRVRWQRLGLDTYRYGVERVCFCDRAGPVRVTVVDGEVESRVFAESGDAVPEGAAGDYPTVDGLFDVLLDAVQRDAFRLDVLYDPDTGVPLDIFIDYQENVADEELGFRVTELPVPVS